MPNFILFYQRPLVGQALFDMKATVSLVISSYFQTGGKKGRREQICKIRWTCPMAQSPGQWIWHKIKRRSKNTLPLPGRFLLTWLFRSYLKINCNMHLCDGVIYCPVWIQLISKKRGKWLRDRPLDHCERGCFLLATADWMCRTQITRDKQSLANEAAIIWIALPRRRQSLHLECKVGTFSLCRAH